MDVRVVVASKNIKTLKTWSLKLKEATRLTETINNDLYYIYN